MAGQHRCRISRSIRILVRHSDPHGKIESDKVAQRPNTSCTRPLERLLLPKVALHPPIHPPLHRNLTNTNHRVCYPKPEPVKRRRLYLPSTPFLHKRTRGNRRRCFQLSRIFGRIHLPPPLKLNLEPLPEKCPHFPRPPSSL